MFWPKRAARAYISQPSRYFEVLDARQHLTVSKI